jgi:D-amino-acid dehydrogenase
MGVGSMSDNVTEKRADVVVLGAGIVGVSAAFAARQRGLSVILVDRREPGSETSYGNAGILSSGSILPLNKPSLWSALPSYMTNRHAALRWDPAWAIRNLDWVVRFLANAAASRIKPRATALHGLIGASLKLHREWIVKAGAAQRIRETGWLKAWRSDAVAAAKQEQAFLAEYGIASRLLDRHAISALEPNILPVYKVGLLHTQTASVDSPGAVVKAYARMFAGSGGEIVQSEIRAIEPDGEGWRVTLANGAISARHVVVALGPWSADLLRPLGYRVPLAFERGYHREFKPNPARSLQRPIHDAEGSFLMTPMEQGIRVTTGVELTSRDAPSSFAQLDQVVPVARGVVEFGEAVGESWRGARPTLPDSLPMIGPAPRHSGLWLAFGNQHIGFTTGPATGAAIAAMIGGAAPSFDIAAFSPSRYL